MADPFLVELDGMIESTHEFIADDRPGTEECRIHDLSALLYVRNLYTEHFQLEENK
jgi:hypothetical protein